VKESILMDKSFNFSKKIIQMYKYLTLEKKEYVLSKQLLRSGTSIGANIREGKYAQRDKDFISKLSIALKEASETEYWLELLKDEYLSEDEVNSLLTDLIQIIKILTSIIKTMKKKLSLKKEITNY